MSEKKWYAVTDSDWGWDSTDADDGAPYIGCHESEEEAAKAALAHFEKRDGQIDGGHLQVALLLVTGFVGFERKDGGIVLWDEVQLL